MRLALAQLNVVVGDLDGNVERIAGAIDEARRAGADLVVLPELAVTGYPPEDLLLRPGFVRASREAVDDVARRCDGIVALVGAPAFDRDLANAAFVCADGTVHGVYRKQFLPNYGVFDEHRYFAAGRELLLLRMGDVLLGPTICEDVWQPGPPATDLALAGATLLVNLSASPYHGGKAEDREEMLVTRARDNAAYVAFCNLVGGQDELVFDGHSVVLDDEGEVIARAPGFEEALLVVDLDPSEALGRRLRDVRRRELERAREEPVSATTIALRTPRATAGSAGSTLTPFAPELEQMRRGLVLGLSDYVAKNGFRNDDVAPYLYRTTDYGRTWTAIAANLPAAPINVVVQDRKNARLLIVGNDLGVFVSIDGGARWAQMKANLPTVAVHGDGLAVGDLPDEPRHDRGVLGARVLPRAEDVEVAQRDRLDPVDTGEAHAEALRRELCDRVRGDRVRRLALHAWKRAAVAVDGRGRGCDDPADPFVASGEENVQRAFDVDGRGAERILDGARHRP